MARVEELEVEIDETGQVRIATKGIKGPACLAYVKLFQELLGDVVEQRLTAEYYEEPPEVEITAAERVRRRYGPGAS